MEPLLAEDVLLLQLDEGTGRPAAPRTLPFVLAGAVLAELEADGAIRFEAPDDEWPDGRVAAVPGAAPEDPLLAVLYSYIEDEPGRPDEFVHLLGGQVSEPLYERLAERGHVERRTKRVLGVVPRTSWPARDRSRVRALRERLDHVLVGGAEPDRRSAIVLALLRAAAVVGDVFTYPDVPRADVERRAIEVTEEAAAWPAVRAAVREIELAAATRLSAPGVSSGTPM